MCDAVTGGGRTRQHAASQGMTTGTNAGDKSCAPRQQQLVAAAAAVADEGKSILLT